MKLYNKFIKQAVLAVLTLVMAISGAVAIGPTKASASGSGCVAGTYQQGSSGNCVKYIQRMLNGLCSYYQYAGCAQLTVDGSFGPATRTQVIKYQAFEGDTQNGIFNTGTENDWWHACISVLYMARGGSSSQNYDAWKAGNSANCNSFGDLNVTPAPTNYNSCTFVGFFEGMYDNTCVTYIQRMLNGFCIVWYDPVEYNCSSLTVDGDFGFLTKNQLIKFQNFTVESESVDGKIFQGDPAYTGNDWYIVCNYAVIAHNIYPSNDAYPAGASANCPWVIYYPE